jgi:hypothetical protein
MMEHTCSSSVLVAAAAVATPLVVFDTVMTLCELGWLRVNDETCRFRSGMCNPALDFQKIILAAENSKGIFGFFLQCY